MKCYFSFHKVQVCPNASMNSKFDITLKINVRRLLNNLKVEIQCFLDDSECNHTEIIVLRRLCSSV